jgi:large repetitive protein
MLAAWALAVALGATTSAFSGQTSNAANTFQAAASFCSSPGTQTASANADSWIDQNSSSSNFGTDAILKVRSQSGNNNMRALVRFALPAAPSGCSVILATLRLYAGSSTAGRTLQALEVSGAWTESGLTWSNQPGTTGLPATTVSGAGWREWLVTTHVQSMYAASNHGFLIRDAFEDGSGAEQQLHSREKAPDNPPQLVITFG